MSAGLLAAVRKAPVNADPTNTEKTRGEEQTVVDSAVPSFSASSEHASSDHALLLPSALLGRPGISPSAAATKEVVAPQQRRVSRRLQSKRSGKMARTTTNQTPGGEGDNSES